MRNNMDIHWLLIYLLIIIKGVKCRLGAYGCDEGWTHFEEHCYAVISQEGNATSARDACSGLGATLASVWSPWERDLILSLWLPPRQEEEQVELLWFGLTGNLDGEWQFEDASKLQVQLQEDKNKMWSILEEAGSELPTTTFLGQCAAFTSRGGLTLVNCSSHGTAVACKKALPKVYVWSSLVNYSSSTNPVVIPPLSTVQQFERVLPPLLVTLPSSEQTILGVALVPTENSCAFACYSAASCRVFELSCRTVDKFCESLSCLMMSEFSSW